MEDLNADLSIYHGGPSADLLSVIHQHTQVDPNTGKRFFRTSPDGLWRPLETREDFRQLNAVVDGYRGAP